MNEVTRLSLVTVGGVGVRSFLVEGGTWEARGRREGRLRGREGSGACHAASLYIQSPWTVSTVERLVPGGRRTEGGKSGTDRMSILPARRWKLLSDLSRPQPLRWAQKYEFTSPSNARQYRDIPPGEQGPTPRPSGCNASRGKFVGAVATSEPCRMPGAGYLLHPK